MSKIAKLFTTLYILISIGLFAYLFTLIDKSQSEHTSLASIVKDIKSGNLDSGAIQYQTISDQAVKQILNQVITNEITQKKIREQIIIEKKTVVDENGYIDNETNDTEGSVNNSNTTDETTTDGEELDPIFTQSPLSSITVQDIAKWKLAYNWGDHSTAGYLTNYIETDPIYSASEAANITLTDTSNWDNAYNWGDHSAAGYLTHNQTINLTGDITGSGTTSITTVVANDSHTHTASTLSGLGVADFTSPNISQWTNDSGYISDGNTGWDNSYGFITDGNTGWDNSYGFITDGNTGWDNSYGFITSADDTVSGSELDGVFLANGILRRTTSGTYSVITDNSSNWNTAYSWGDHSLAGYLTSEVDGSTTNELQNLFSTVSDGTNTATVDSLNDTLKFIAGANVTILATNDDPTNGDYIQISSSDQYTGTITSISTGNGLSGGTITSTGSLSINAPTCTGDNKLQWNGTSFTCVSDPAGAIYTAGNDLYLASNTFNLDSTLNYVNAITFDGGNLTLSTTTSGNIILDAAGTVKIGATGTGKLDVGTVDPPYTINGEKFATYLASMIGVKEEVTDKVKVSQYDKKTNAYKYEIAFPTLEKGTDLWLFSRTTDLKNNINELVTILTAEGRTDVWYELDEENYTLTLYSERPTTISYRLTAPRFDADQWKNTREEGVDGFVLDIPEEW